MTDFETQAQHMLRQSEQTVSDDIGQQLASGRLHAIQNAEKKPRIPGFLLPATGMAAASLMAMVLLVSPATQLPDTENNTVINESLELYDDLEFYQWLADETTSLQG